MCVLRTKHYHLYCGDVDNNTKAVLIVVGFVFYNSTSKCGIFHNDTWYDWSQGDVGSLNYFSFIIITCIHRLTLSL